MTCIVGIVESGQVYIGADSAGVGGNDVTIRKDKKVFKINSGEHDIVIGCTSSFRMIDILKYNLDLLPIKDMDEHKYLVTVFIPHIRKVFKENGYMMSTKDGDDLGGTFLIGINGRLFRISNDFQVGESVDKFEAVGCGDSYALGALEVIYGWSLKSCPVSCIEYALEISSKRSSGVRPPFHIESIGDFRESINSDTLFPDDEISS